MHRKTGPALLALLLMTGACTSGNTAPTSTKNTVTTTLTSTTTATPTTTTTLRPGIDLSRYPWLLHGLDGIRSPEGLLIWETDPILGARNLARDGIGGIAFVDVAGLWWLSAGATEPTLVTTENEFELLEVVVDEGRPIARLGFCDTTYIRLSDGTEVTPATIGRIEVECATGTETWTAANGLSAQIVRPTLVPGGVGYSDDVVEPAHLLVSQGDEVVLDIRVGGIHEAYARIHDFDGRQLVVSRFPYEPASPPESFFVFDLGCGTCLRSFSALATAALTGPDTDWHGPVQPPEYRAFAATPLLTDEGIRDLEDGRYLAWIDHASGDRLDFDLGVWFGGNEANHIALVDGVTEIPVPNDYYIRNQDPTILELPVSSEVSVTSVWYDYDTDPDLENDPISYADLLTVLASDAEDVRSNLRHDPWWITVENGVIVNLDEQYIP